MKIAEKYNLSGQQVYHILHRSPDYTPHKENIGSAAQFKKRQRNAEIVADVRANPYMTVGEIMDKYGLSESTTYQVFREAGHPISGGLVRFGPEPPMNIPEFKHSPKVLGLQREALEDTKTQEEVEARNNDILKDYKAGVKVENIAVRYNVTPRFIAGLYRNTGHIIPSTARTCAATQKVKKDAAGRSLRGDCGRIPEREKRLRQLLKTIRLPWVRPIRFCTTTESFLNR